MKIFNKTVIKYWFTICVYFLFHIFIINTAFATTTCYFTYKSERFDTTFRINSGSETNPNILLFEEIKKGMPYVLGLEKNINESMPKFTIYLDCRSGNQSILQINGNPKVDFPCEKTTLGEIIVQMGNLINIKNITPVFEISGYTLQIAYVQKKINLQNEEDRWRKILGKKENVSIIDIDCDPNYLPIYNYGYKSGAYAIRFGLFSSFDNAMKAIKHLNLNKNNTQIIPVNFKLEDMKNIFIHSR